MGILCNHLYRPEDHKSIRIATKKDGFPCGDPSFGLLMIQARFSLQLGAGRDQSLAVLVAFVLCKVLDEAASQIL